MAWLKHGQLGSSGLCLPHGNTPMTVGPLLLLQAPASPAEAEALVFADAWLKYAQEQLQQHGTNIKPNVHFLPGNQFSSKALPCWHLLCALG